MDAEDPENGRAEQEPRRANKLHIFISTLITVTSMTILDVYLVQQNYGSRRIGVSVMLVINELCHMLALRYIGFWVGSEVRTNRRGWSVVSWFLFIVIYDVKMFFVLQHIWKKCSPDVLIINNDVIDPTSQSLLGPNVFDDNDATNDGLAIPVISEQRDSCDYSMLGKKMLMIFQATLIPGLYLTLVGADHMRTLTDFRHLEEVKMRVFWVVVDILDLLQLQSSLWETNTHKFPYTSAAVIYFYCYVSLIILPPISLGEMSKRDGSLSPHKMIFYLTASVAFVNVGTTVIRCFLLFYYVFNLTSSVFLAKNIICLGIQVTKVIQLEQLKKKEGNDEFNVKSNEDEAEKQDSYKKDLIVDMDTNSDDSDDFSIKSLPCPQHHFDSFKRSNDIFNESSSGCAVHNSLDQKRSNYGGASTFHQEFCFSPSNTASNEPSSCHINLERKFIEHYRSLDKETQFSGGLRQDDNDVVRPVVSESEAASSFVVLSKARAKTKLPEQSCKKKTELNFSAQNKKRYPSNDILSTSLPNSRYIVTPPSSFNDSLSQSPSIDKRARLKKRTPALATSLQNEMACLPQFEPQKTPLNKFNSTSLIRIDNHQPINDPSMSAKVMDNCTCSKFKAHTRYNSELVSDSDISEVAVPPLKAVLQSTGAKKKVFHDVKSDCSTSV